MVCNYYINNEYHTVCSINYQIKHICKKMTLIANTVVSELWENTLKYLIYIALVFPNT